MTVATLLKSREKRLAALEQAVKNSPEVKARQELAALDAEIEAARNAEQAALLAVDQAEMTAIHQELDRAAVEVVKTLRKQKTELDRLMELNRRAAVLQYKHDTTRGYGMTSSAFVISATWKAVTALLRSLEMSYPRIAKRP